MAGVQDGLTVVAPIIPGRLAALELCLDAMDVQIREGKTGRTPGVLLPFGELPNVHFARLAIVDFAVDVGAGSEPRLVFCTDFDGSAERHIEDIGALLADGLDQVFEYCEGYGAISAASRGERVRTFIHRRRVPWRVFYSGAPGRTVGQIRAEARLHATIQSFLADSATQKELGRMDHAGLRSAIQTHVRLQHTPDGSAEFWWAEMPDVSEINTTRYHLISYMVLVAAAPLLPLLLVLAVVQILTELVRRPTYNPPVTSAEKDCIKRDNQSGQPGGQNRMTAITVVRPRRLWLVKLALRVINFRVRYTYYEGSLAGIVTIHFARWVLVDRCLLFCSNYDGGWESYLGEFIDRATWGLNLIWGNAIGYPPTVALVFRGAADEQRFKAYTQRRQVPTQVWYSAYPDISIANVKRNFQLRNGLFAELSDAELTDWARLL